MRRAQQGLAVRAASIASTLDHRLVHNSHIFYGWVVVAAGTLGLIASGPGQTYVISIFAEDMAQHVQTTSSGVSTLYSVGILVSCLLAPLTGRQADRWGPRVVGVALILLLGLSCLFTSLAQSGLLLLGAFVALRACCQGLVLVSHNVINLWWKRRRGLATGIASSVSSLLGLGATPYLVHLVALRLGWRGTYVLMGLVLVLAIAPVVALLSRSRPERYGLRVDGAQVDAAADVPDSAGGIADGWALTEAMSTPTFWILAVGLASVAMMDTGVSFHIVSIFAEKGMTAGEAAAAFAPFGAATALMALASGYLADRVPQRWLSVALFLLQAGALFIAASLSTPGQAAILGLMRGMCIGLFRIVGMTVWADYYGRRQLGRITGVFMAIQTIGASLGPLPLGFARDVLGTFGPALRAGAWLSVSTAVACLFARAPLARVVGAPHRGP